VALRAVFHVLIRSRIHLSTPRVAMALLQSKVFRKELSHKTIRRFWMRMFDTEEILKPSTSTEVGTAIHELIERYIYHVINQNKN